MILGHGLDLTIHAIWAGLGMERNANEWKEMERTCKQNFKEIGVTRSGKELKRKE